VNRVLVIGGTSGIGAAIFEEVWGREEVEFRLGACPDSEPTVDVRKAWTMERSIIDNHITHVVYSAGVNELRWLRDTYREGVEDLFNVNTFGFIMLMGIIARRTTPVRSVLAVSSDAAVRPMRTSIAYCSSKAALNMAVRCAARELAPDVRVNAIAPGKVADTPMTDYVDSTVPALRGWTREYADRYEAASSPLGRPLTKSEVARTAVDILLNPSPGYTGEIVTINGGR
jgi:NAD(P)-dependent dehydrogenase (short-subunit alcohol dehydrogenase family)